MAANDSLRRAELLQKINGVFDRYGLDHWDERDLGLATGREIEIVDVDEHVFDRHAPYFVIITFQVHRPQKGRWGWEWTQATHPIRFNTRPSIVVAAQVNGGLVFVKQHRPAVHDHPWELPRGWIPADVASDPRRAVRHLLERECGAEWTAGLSSINPIDLGIGWPDSSNRADHIQIYYLEARNERPLPTRIGLLTLRLGHLRSVHGPNVPEGRLDVDHLEDEGKLADMFTSVALRKMERHLARKSPPQ